MGKQDSDIVGWFTTNSGKHIPMMKGESRQDALKRVLGNGDKSKSQPKAEHKSKKNEVVDKNEETKHKQIKRAEEEAKRLNAEQRYQNELKKGNSVTINKDGDLVFNGKKVEKLDTTDATEPNPKKDLPDGDSLYQSLDENGNLTKERQELHRQIMEEYFKDQKPYAPGQKRLALFTGGGGASGKGRLGREISSFYSSDDKPVIIDPDEIKKRLSVADGINPKDFNAGFYHEESSALAKQIYHTAVSHGFPVMYDGTATSVDSTIARVKQARDNGYRTECNFIRVNSDTMRGNSIARFVRGEEVTHKNGSKGRIHRLVPVEQILKAHQKAPNAVAQIGDDFDSFTLWDNSGNKMTKVASRKDGDKLVVHNRTLWRDFANQKAEFTWTKEATDKYVRDAKKALAESKKKGGK